MNTTVSPSLLLLLGMLCAPGTAQGFCSLAAAQPEMAYVGGYWGGGYVPYVFDGSVTPAQQQLMRAAMDRLEATALIRVRPRIGEPDYLVVKTVPGYISSSNIGRIGGRQEIWIGSQAWNNQSVLLHEMIHALGFGHEHQRPDRDNYITVQTGNIDPAYLHNFNIIPAATYGDFPYDYQSIMHYGAGDFSINSLPSITANSPWQGSSMRGNDLSEGDLAMLQIAYGPPVDQWNQVSSSSNVGPRYLPAMTYSPSLGRTLLFGGRHGTSYFNDTWEYNGSSWSLLPSLGAPPREGATLTYEPATQSVWLFGGEGSGGTTYQDIWQLTGGAWQNRTPTSGPSPLPRSQHAMAWSASAQKLVLFGGYVPGGGLLGDTWLFDVVTGTWTQHGGTAPQARAAHAMAVDPATGHVLLFGGRLGAPAYAELNDTWTFSGTGWTQQFPHGPSPNPRYVTGMVSDPGRGSVVLWAGWHMGSRDDVWEWRNGLWWFRHQTGRPGLRHAHGTSFDTARQRMVVFGGYDTTNGYYTDTWEYSLSYPSGRSQFGTGCGASPTPALQAGTTPSGFLGHPITFDVDHANGLTIGMVGWTREATSLAPYGLPGCTLLASPVTTVPALPLGGARARMTLSLPYTHAILGLHIVAQAFVFDPIANAFGLATSNGADVTIGLR